MTKFRPLAMGFHSHVLSLDSCSSATSKILNASAQGRVADVVTDHGVLSGIAGHYLASEKLFKEGKTPTKIKSIHGCEIYMVDEDRPPKVYKNGKVDPQYYHLTIHFKTQAAYQYFCELSPIAESRAVVRFGERKPLIYFKELEPISGQITIGTGCIGSPVGKNILTGRKDLAIQWYERLRNLAGPGNMYVEVMPHICNRSWVAPKVSKEGMILEQGYFGPAIQRMDANALDAPFEPDPCTGEIDLQRPANQFVIEMGKKYGDPCVVSLDDHFSKEEDYVVQAAMLSNGNERFRFYNKYFAMDSDQAADVFKKQMNTSDRDIEEWIDNGYKFVELFNDYKFVTAKDRILLPTTEMVYNVKTDSLTVLRRLIDKYGMMPKEDHPQYQVYKDRLEYEISVLHNNGTADFLPYFFVIEDLASYCRTNRIATNTRGSAGGVLILFLLRISITDPIKYDLPFSRFINLGRISTGNYPDIDFDVEDREPVIAYLYEKYGKQIGLISTDLLMRLKTSILDVERADKGRVPLEVSDMCKYIKGASQGQSDKDWLFGYTDKETDAHVPGFMEDTKDATAHRLREYSKSNPEIWDTVLKCIGVVKGRGVHAGGVVITPGEIQSFFPMINSNKGLSVAYEMKALEAAGGIKYDILGVSTLKAIGITFKSIKEHTGTQLEWKEPPYQKEVYDKIIGAGLLAGIFQLNTKTVRPGVEKLRPKSIKEISNITSIYRPGSLDSEAPKPGYIGSAVDYYIDVHLGKESPYFVHPSLEPILRDTYGCIISQSQQMKIAMLILDFGDAEADQFRRATGKKDKKQTEENCEKLRAGCMAKGWTKQQADILISSFVAASNYSFDSSHAVSYSIVAYLGCWLKYNYPLHFWKGQLQISDAEEIQGLLHECGDLILDVSATKSHPFEWMIEGNRLRAPLSIVKGVGGKAAERLYEAGRGMNAAPEWSQYLEQLKLTKPAAPAIFNLIYMGAMDCFIEHSSANNMAAYGLMVLQVKKALKSKANLSKGYKTDNIVLADVKNPLDLVKWRIGYNPISKSNLVGLFKESLEALGFRQQPSLRFPYVKAAQERIPQASIITNLTNFMAKYPGTPTFNAICKGEANLVLFGYVLSVKFFKYQAGTKEAMKLSIYTGDEMLELVVWPDKSGSVPAAMMEKVRKNKASLFQIKTQIKAGVPSYRLGHISQLTLPVFPLLVPAIDDSVEIKEPKIEKVKKVRAKKPQKTESQEAVGAEELLNQRPQEGVSQNTSIQPGV